MAFQNLTYDIKGNGHKLIDILLRTCSIETFSNEEVPPVELLHKGQIFFNTSKNAIGIFNGSEVIYTNSSEVATVDTSEIPMASLTQAGLVKLSDQFYINEDEQLCLDLSSIKINLENIVLGRNLVSRKEVGGIYIGDEFLKDENLLEFLTKMLSARVGAKYKAPRLILQKKNSEFEYELGEIVSETITAIFEKNDAGNISDYILSLNGTRINTDNELITSTELTIDRGFNELSAKLDYLDGPIKNDNLGVASPIGRIKSGELKQTLLIKGSRRSFATSETTPINELSTERCRAFNESFLGVKEGDSIKVSVKQGSKYIAFAYPTTLGEPQSCIQKNSGVNILQAFSKRIVQIEGANNYGAVDYNVYEYSSLKCLQEDTFTFNL